tara:strand:+ start:22323 stop:23681 length:1359 start_codon:yes stop_codon:yes gene_type:complete
MSIKYFTQNNLNDFSQRCNVEKENFIAAYQTTLAAKTALTRQNKFKKHTKDETNPFFASLLRVYPSVLNAGSFSTFTFTKSKLILISDMYLNKTDGAFANIKICFLIDETDTSATIRFDSPLALKIIGKKTPSKGISSFQIYNHFYEKFNEQVSSQTFTMERFLPTVYKRAMHYDPLFSIQDNTNEGKHVLYFTMPVARGIRLSSYLESKSNLSKSIPHYLAFPLKQKLELLLSIAVSINQFHTDTHCSHNDLKPDNIFTDLASDGKFNSTLIDLDLAKAFGDNFKLEGTPAYGPPEIYGPGRQLPTGAPQFTYSSKQDVFAFGVITARILANIHEEAICDHFQGPAGLIGLHNPVYESEYISLKQPSHYAGLYNLASHSTFAKSLSALTMKCIAENPNDRASFSSVIADLQQLAAAVPACYYPNITVPMPTMPSQHALKLDWAHQEIGSEN